MPESLSGILGSCSRVFQGWLLKVGCGIVGKVERISAPVSSELRHVYELNLEVEYWPFFCLILTNKEDRVKEHGWMGVLDIHGLEGAFAPPSRGLGDFIGFRSKWCLPRLYNMDHVQ